MKQQDITKQHKCIRITYFWHKIHVVQYICTNALEKLPDSALDITLKMETAATPGMLVPMYHTKKHHIPDIQCHKNLNPQLNHTSYNHLIIRCTHVCCWWWCKVKCPSSPLVPLVILIRSRVRVIKMMLLTSPSSLPHTAPDLR